MESKISWRNKLKQQRSELEEKLRLSWSQRICEKLEKYLQSVDYDQIFAFRSYSSEVNINPLIDELSRNQKVALPRCQSNGIMIFYPYSAQDTLEKNVYGIYEPKPSVVQEPSEKSIILIPALAISRTGHRIGYGGGFYDRYLEKYAKEKKIGIIYEMFYAFAMQEEAHDIALDMVIHQSKIEII